MTEKHHTAHHQTHAHEKKHEGEWEPKIIGFLCNWCSYAGADLCGVSRYQYPTNIRPVRVMCSTRISPHLVLDIFKAGADGILLGGCHIGDCHYISGNYYTEKRVNLMKKLLKESGIAPERLRLEWVSASEGEKFSKVVTEFTETVKALGPNKVKKDERLMSRVAAADMASETFRLKALVGKELNLVGKGNVYDNKLDPEEIEKIITEATSDEFERSLILELSRTKARSVKELGEIMEVPTDKVLRHIVLLRQNSLIAMEHPEGFTPTYKTIEIGGEQ
ncbi:MAG: hydrogenase iron-sulfur subunit [Candidatus Thermoplasmatota archaeon]|nr:hydrogenase iron-sulfur subunit [Candidatus Thermoplasmatota archaeon]